MNQPLQTAYSAYAGSGTSVEQRNKVLRNTYWLLALSMVPTVLGAWVGVSTGLMRALSPGLSMILFLAGAFGLMYLIQRNKNSAAGVPLLLAFTFFMGLMLSRLVGAVLGMSNGLSLVTMAFAGTATIFLGMASLSSIIKRDLSNLAKWLFIGVVMLMFAGIANIFFQSSALAITLSLIGMGIFSAFILVDLKRVQDGTETNYISATLSVYMSVYNVFSSLLSFLGLTSGSSD
jgi:modulator of FtsH protease